MTNAFSSKARQVTLRTASTTEGWGVGGSELGINHCEGTWAARWYADMGRVRDFERLNFERGKSLRLLMDENDHLYEETNLLDSSSCSSNRLLRHLVGTKMVENFLEKIRMSEGHQE